MSIGLDSRAFLRVRFDFAISSIYDIERDTLDFSRNGGLVGRSSFSQICLPSSLLPINRALRMGFNAPKLQIADMPSAPRKR